MVDEAEPEQISIFDLESVSNQNMVKQEIRKNEKQEKLDKAVDQIRKKYGEGAIVRGSLKK